MRPLLVQTEAPTDWTLETCWDQTGKAVASRDIDAIDPQNRAMIDSGNGKSRRKPIKPCKESKEDLR